MKRILMTTGIAVLALATVVGAQAYQFNTNLTVGSTGPDVVALQTALIAAGNDIPAVTSGAAAKGYFGSQTKSAVMAYQSANGIPNTGFVGPLTRGSLNSGGGVATVPGTPSVVVCPVGYVCTPAVGTAPVTGSVTGLTPGTDGSVLVAQSSYVSTGASVKKGETKNVVAARLQATAGPVSIARVDAHFSVRPWLYFSKATLKDSTGTVLATKTLGSVSDVTEVTVGSDYLVRFDGLNYVVTPGTDRDLVVEVSVLAATDKITNGMSVTAAIPSGAIRTVNGLGISDSVGGTALSGSTLPTTGAGAATFTLSSTGSVADISTRVSPSAPAVQATVPASATVPTNDVMLGLFSLKSANNSATINSMNFQTNTTITGSVSSTFQTGVFSNMRIVVNGQSYGAASYTAAGLATFNNLTIPLSQDLWTDIKLVADVAATSTDVLASSTMLAAKIDAIDSTYTAATIGGVAMADAAGSNQTSVNTLMTVNSMSLSLGATPAVITQEIKIGGTGTNAGKTSSAAVAYTFTLTNNSSNSLYVSGTVSTLINGTSTVPASNASSTITAIEPTPAVAGDGTGYYIIPSGGGSRTFTVTGTIASPGGATAQQRMSITSIQYGATTAGTGSSITAGLTTLTKSIILTPAN